MIDYDEIKTVNQLLEEAQSDDSDNREKVREAHHFLDKRDGQWEPSIIRKMTGRPRYTFDKCNPIIDDIAGEMEQADFDIRVRPSGGEATKETAMLYDGLIRNIETMSNASYVYSSQGREMVASGIGGWEVYQDWASTDSFEQDLMIKPIWNFEDRVWFDPGAEKQDKSDARYAFDLQNLTPDEYEERFPDGSKMSIGSDKCYDTYTRKPAFITIGRILYKQEYDRTLVLMSDGSVRDKTDDFDKVVDELAEQGVTIEKERKTKGIKVISRLFDGGAFLNEKQDTVFSYIPIVPTYGNYKIRDKGKVIYRGEVDKLIDPQRVYNYSRSREVEEVALSPKPKYWVTRKQMENAEDRAKLQTLNTNADPAQLYTNDPEAPGAPPFVGGAAVNPGLQVAVQNSLQDIATTAGRGSVQGGDLDGPLSGVAIQKLQNKGDNKSIKYFKSQEVAICHTASILIDAIPKVYDTARQVRILNEDSSFEMKTINDQVFDQETKQFITVNDLRKGKYDVTCDVGPAFKNRQQESVKALQELSAVIPGLAEITADIQLQNIASPGVDLAAERVRRRLFESNAIPESQLTAEEKQEIAQAQAAAAQKPPEDDPATKVANAELQRVEAETADTISRARDRESQTILKSRDQLLRARSDQSKLELQELTLFLKQQAQVTKQQQDQISAVRDGQQMIVDNLNTQADTLKKLFEAMGAQAVIGGGNVEAYANQAEIITEDQENL